MKQNGTAMTLIVNDDNPVVEEETEQVVEVVEEATDDHKESSEQSIMISTDNSLTRQEDATRTEKKFKNKNYCHTHGYECSNDHDSGHCMWPEKGHKPCATAENPMGGCLLYKRLWQSYCVEVQ